MPNMGTLGQKNERGVRIKSHKQILSTGPSPRIKKWSGGGNHRVPKTREGESTRGGLFPVSLGGFGVSP